MESNDEFIARVESEASMPDKTTVTGELPALPEPNSYCTHADSHEYDVFDADQMRAYATAALAQKDGEIERMKAALRDLVDRYEEICRAKDPSYALDDDAITSARAALGSQA